MITSLWCTLFAVLVPLGKAEALRRWGSVNETTPGGGLRRYTAAAHTCSTQPMIHYQHDVRVAAARGTRGVKMLSFTNNAFLSPCIVLETGACSSARLNYNRGAVVRISCVGNKKAGFYFYTVL